MIKTQLSSVNYQWLVDNIKSSFDKSNVVLQDDRNTIKVLEFNQKKLVVKSFVVPNLIDRFIYTYLKKSKVWRAYEFGLRIADFTPKVIARIEHYQPLLTKSYLICEKFEADFDIRAALLNTPAQKEQILQQFAQFVFELHQKNIIHKDLSPGNILIQQHKTRFIFKVIDINRMVFKVPNIKERAKNFNKLWADDDDLTVILEAYANLAKIDKHNFIRLGIKYNQINKDTKTRKRKIKEVLGLC